MSTIQLDTLAKPWSNARRIIIWIAIAALSLGCRQVQSSSAVELSGEQVGNVVTIVMSNNSAVPITINRLFAPGYPDSSIEYSVASEPIVSADLGSAHIIDPSSLPLRLDPGAFYGFRINAEDMKSAVGFKERCVNITLVYSNPRRESVFSEVDAKSAPIRVCAKE